ncbi:MAG: hypothetical protein QW040_01210 [Candidatus Aenigmatarchaeota archaeon]
MKDYLSRLIEYEELIKEIEIAGEEHLKIIKQNLSSYLKKAEELRTRIASDVFLNAEDKEKLLRKISFYLQQVKPREDELHLNSFLLGILLALLIKEGVLPELIENFFGDRNAVSLYPQKDIENLYKQLM